VSDEHLLKKLSSIVNTERDCFVIILGWSLNRVMQLANSFIGREEQYGIVFPLKHFGERRLEDRNGNRFFFMIFRDIDKMRGMIPDVVLYDEELMWYLNRFNEIKRFGDRAPLNYERKFGKEYSNMLR